MLTPEGRLKEFVKRDLKARSAYFFMPVQTGYGMTTLDILCCIGGRFLAIETKAPGKEPTRRQCLTLEQIKASGGAAFFCDSKESYLLGMQENGFSAQSSGDPDPSSHPSQRVAELPISE